MKLALAGLFLFVLFEPTPAEDYKIHIYVSTSMAWNDARSYCESYFTELSSSLSEEESKKLMNAEGNFSNAWIGLTKIKNQWVWVNGQKASDFKPSPNSNLNSDCAYVEQQRSTLLVDLCSNLHPFFCSMTLVTANMAWEDALEYCRTHYADLAGYQVNYLDGKRIPSMTDSVWMGLRFLAGEWNWVGRGFSHIPYQGPLKSCPPTPYRCGAFNRKTARLENRNCNESLNFICY